MITVLFYSFILLCSTFFVWLSEKGRFKIDRWVLLGIAFLLVFIPSAIRYDIGTDYGNYLAIYEDLQELESYKLKEPGFYLVNYLLISIGAHFQWMFSAFAFIFTAVAFKAYTRKQAWLLHFLFFSMLWFFSFNGMRQAVALSWCLLALFCFFDRRYILFLILTLIGSTFHQSALFITAAGIVALIPLNNKIKTHIAPVVFILFIIYAYFAMHDLIMYMEQFISLLGLKYSEYFSNTKHLVERDFGSGLGVLTKVLFSIYIILNSNQLLKINENYWLLLILIFAYAIGLVLASGIIIFGRMADTFVVAQIIGAYLLLQLPKSKSINYLVLIMFLVFLLMSFVKDGFGVENSYGDPKLNPYKYILNGN